MFSNMVRSNKRSWNKRTAVRKTVDKNHLTNAREQKICSGTKGRGTIVLHPSGRFGHWLTGFQQASTTDPELLHLCLNSP